MNNKEEFKKFVRDNPKLVKYVRNGEKTWQNFYEIFNLYGDDSSVWNEYLDNNNKVNNDSNSFDIFSWIKSIDLDNIQNSVASIQRVLGVFQDLNNNNSVSTNEEYKPRPLYKHFED